MRHPLSRALVAALAVAGLTACSPASPTTVTAPASSAPAAPPSTVSAPATPATSAPAPTKTVTAAPAPSTATATTTATATATKSVTDAPAAPKVVDKEKFKVTSEPSGYGYYFVTPSGLIRCGLSVANTTNTVTCGVTSPVAGFDSCPGDEKHFPFVAVGQAGEKRRGCTTGSGEVRNTQKPSQTLNYGETLKVGDVACTVEETGVTCVDSKFNGKLVVSKESLTVS